MSRRCCFPLVFVAITLSVLFAQGRKTVAGVVSAASGSVVANAEVALVAFDPDKQDNATQYARTDESGHYRFANVNMSRGLTLSVKMDGKIPYSQTFTTKSNTSDVLVIDISVER